MRREQLEIADGSSDASDDALEKDRRFVTALARGLELLSCFKADETFLTNAEIAKRTGLPKPTVSRLAFTLTELGYLNYSEETGKYTLGAAVLSLGNTFLSKKNIRQLARPLMQELSEYAHGSVALGVRERFDIVYIENCRSDSASFTLRLDVGSHISLATSVIGNAYLCGLQERQRELLLDQIKLRNEHDWPKIKTIVEQALKDYHEKGFCTSIGNWRKDVNSVGVPYIPADGSEVMAFNCGGPAFQMRRHMLEDDIGPRLVNLVKTLQEEVKRKG